MDILKHLQTSVAQAFETSFDDAYRHLHTELAFRDARVKAAENEAAAANDARINAATKFEELEHEMQILREELCNHQADTKELEASASKSHGMREAYSPDRILETYNIGEKDNLHSDWIEGRKIVDSKYRALYGEVQTLIKVSGELRTQVKRHKEKLKQWKDSITRDEFTLVLDGSPVTFRRVPTAANGKQVELQTPKPRLSVIEPLEAVRDIAAVDASTINPELPRSTPISNHQGSGKSIRTDGAHSDGLPEPPSILSDRSVVTIEVEKSDHSTAPVTWPPKRKRLPIPQPRLMSSSNHQPTSDKVPPSIVIKSEPMSSSPLGKTPQCCAPNPPATQDLDEVGGAVETPTKRKGNNPEQGHDVPFIRQSGGLEGSCCNNMRPSPGTQLSKTPQSGEVKHRDPSGSSRRLDGEGSRRLERVAQQGLPSVAEDGDDSYFDIGPAKRQQKSPSSSIHIEHTNPNLNISYAQQRLQNLLENPRSPRSPLHAPRKSLSTVTSGTNSLQNFDDVIDRNSPIADDNPVSKMPRGMERHTVWNGLADGNGSRVDSFKDSFPEPRPEDEPYRARPLHRLEPSHFKINPCNNAGLDFAFNEVARKKDERKNISGCTRADCCRGKFLAMARLGGLPPELRKSVQEDPSSLDNQMGGRQHSLGMSGSRDIDGLLPGARAIANCYGKHRHDQRPPTPPGFWRTEMPSTQDLERDHQEARRQEREMVEERYMEAMRPGGVWKYADE